MMNEYLAWGWSTFFSAQANPLEQRVARVLEEQKERYKLWTPQGIRFGRVRGKLRFEAAARLDYPCVGDWVLLDGQIPEKEEEQRIDSLLTRKTLLYRKAAGEKEEKQAIAANIDTVFILSSANQDWNKRRIERYLSIVRDAGAEPVLLVSKIDLAEKDLADLSQDFSLPVLGISVKKPESLEQLNPWLKQGQTIAFVGSSGVGKSSLINTLLGKEVQAVREIREHDARGKHTTTTRTLFQIPGGSLVIDTPGMREIQIADDQEAGVEDSFSEISSLRCKFTNCKHEKEPGCAVLEAIQSGNLSEERLTAYRKLERELAHQRRKEDKAFQSAEKKQWKNISKAVKDTHKRKRPKGDL